MAIDANEIGSATAPVADETENLATPGLAWVGESHMTGNAEPPTGLTQLGPLHFSWDVLIVNPLGLHIRPATEIVKLANQFACEIKIHKGNEQVDGKSILNLIGLFAEQGTPLRLEGRGEDAPKALAALAKLIDSGFDEMGSE